METIDTSILTETHAASLLRPRPADSHKGTFGHALIIAGQHGMMGAATLSAQAAMRCGTGKLTLHIPESERVIPQIAIPEAILHFDEHMTSHWASPLEITNYSSCLIGPGIGLNGETQFALRTQLKIFLEAETSLSPLPLVLDADAINIVSNDFQMLSYLPAETILTPHVGEMKRLCAALELPCTTQEETLRSTKTVATDLQLNIVLKSHHTHIFMANGDAFINTQHGNSGMATAGSGDVLAGCIVGLLAQGYSPSDATQLAVMLHAISGDYAAASLGEHSMLASDLVTNLPKSFIHLLHLIQQ